MVYAQYKLHFKKKHYLQMRSFTKTAFVNVIYLFTNAVITKTAFVNLKPLKPPLIQKNIQMRLFQITAFINRIYKCGSIAAYVLQLRADQMRL